MKELQVTLYCDGHAMRDQRQPATYTVTAMVGEEGPKEIDLCAGCYGKLAAPLEAILIRFGQDAQQVKRIGKAVGVEPADRRESPSVGGGYVCPIDGVVRSNPSAFVQHAREKHDVVAPPYPLECAEHGVVSTGTPQVGHFAKTHGVTAIVRADEVLEQLRGTRADDGQQQLELVASSATPSVAAFQCPVDNKTFTLYKLLAQHATNIHKIEHPEACPDCAFASNAKGVVAHRMSKHDFDPRADMLNRLAALAAEAA